jgi:hypothetical protein
MISMTPNFSKKFEGTLSEKICKLMLRLLNLNEIFTCFIKKIVIFTESFLSVLRILNRLEVGVFDRTVKLDSLELHAVRVNESFAFLTLTVNNYYTVDGKITKLNFANQKKGKVFLNRTNTGNLERKLYLIH